MSYKIQVKTPVVPSHDVVAILTSRLQNVVKDKKAEVLFYKDHVGCEFDVTVLKNNYEQADLRTDCLNSLFSYFFSKIN